MSGKAKAPRPGRGGWWFRPLALALVYYGVGRLVWLLTVAPGHAAALWPPAGIALGVMLLSTDLSLCVGAAAGGFALALQAALTGGGLGLWRACAVAAAVGVGAGLEPLVAALLLRRKRGTLSSAAVRARWLEPREVVRFAALAAPAPALIGAALASGARFWAGLVPLADLPRTAALWWAGDMLGLVVFAPLVLLLGAPRREMVWRRRLLVAIPVALVTALSMALFVRADRWDEHRGEAVVRRRADALTGAVERSLVYHLDALRTVADFLAAAGRVDAEAFRRVATGAVVRHFAFAALAWAPAPTDGRGVTVEIVDPSAADPQLPGTDLAADPARKEALMAARTSGQALVLDPGEASESPGLWVFVPAPGRTGENGVAGFVGALLRLDALVARSAAGVERTGIGLELRDDAGRPVYRLPESSSVTVVADGRSTPPSIELPGPTRLAIGDRTFILIPEVNPGALAAERSGEAWIVLVAGMLLVALLEGVLLVAAGRLAARDAFLEPDWSSSYRTDAEATVPGQ